MLWQASQRRRVRRDGECCKNTRPYAAVRRWADTRGCREEQGMQRRDSVRRCAQWCRAATMQRARVCSGSGEQTSSPEGLDKRLVEVVVTATIVGVATRGGRVDYRPSVCGGRGCRTRVARRWECSQSRWRPCDLAPSLGRWVGGWCRSGCADDDAGCGRGSRLGKEGAPAGQGRIKAASSWCGRLRSGSDRHS
jgi:hypothetical protein